MSTVPEGPPTRLIWKGRPEDIVRKWGPERIETGWWRNKHVRRDYYRVELATGQWLWLFRCLNQKTWFLHGTFE